MGDTLAELRKQIDVVDSSILELLEDRFKLTEQVGVYKLQTKDSIVQNGRWQELLHNLKTEAETKGLSAEMVESIWNEIHKHSVTQQNKIKESVTTK